MRLKFSVPSLLPGLIEDLDLFKIEKPKRLLRPPRDIEEIADSIRKKGLLQPIIVRSRTDDNQEIFFEIVAGIRRYLACKSLGWKKITCHIVELDDKGAFEISLVENVQRHMLSPIEEAQAFKTYVSDYGWGGMSVLAARIGKSTSYITKRIKLLDLPQDVLQSIINSSISVSTAEELCAVKNLSKQSELSSLISKRHLSLRNVRELVKDMDETGSSQWQEKEDDIFLTTRHIDDPLVDARKIFDRSIITLRIALDRLATIIDRCNRDSIVYELLMYHKSILHQQIDLLIKEKKKARSRYIR